MMRFLAAGCLLLAIAQVSNGAKNKIPCPPEVGGLLTDGEPDTPSPFHDVTAAEYQRVYDFLMTQDEVNLASPDTQDLNTATIFTADLLLPAKKDVLSFLDNQGAQPVREARVMVFRGDKTPPLVEEYRVGPLDNPTYADLIVNSQRKNPVPFSVRPLNHREFDAMMEHVLIGLVDAQVGDILMESYGARYANCGDNCLYYNVAAMGTAFFGDINVRKSWFVALYDVEFLILHPTDFSVLIDMSSTDPSQWTVDRVWYAGTFFDSLADFKDRYYNDPTINKTRVTPPEGGRSLFSSLNVRGDAVPTPPQRPPVQIEPDGKRYSIEHRHVTYMHWDFDFRLSPYTGPAVMDVRFQGDRIAYELGLSEISVFYTGGGPMQQVMNYVDSGALLGIQSRSLVPGADCPEGATYIDLPFLGEFQDGPTNNPRAMCVFEQNTGDPLRRHLTWRWKGAFYGGIADSVLVVRSAMTIFNYDYVIDFKFYQSGAMEAKAISTGYIMGSFYNSGEDPYGWVLRDNLSGNLHHHMFNFKADLDIAGTSNRYETLAFTAEDIELSYLDPPIQYNQLRFERSLRETEEGSLFHYDFQKPAYHIVHNDQNKTAFGVPRAYRIHMGAMSPQLLRHDHNHEGSIPWARQQLAVTVHKDEEWSSSSPFGMFDSEDPTVDFAKYISDESIVDQDLVFWVTMGTHHLPHTEDLPITPTPGGHLSFFLLPYNYFPECPSSSSRDHIRLEFAKPGDGSSGVKVTRNGNTNKGMCGKPSLKDLVKADFEDFLVFE
ncbi:putative amine oxidase [copper-containing] [Littorina saxatilis]|uniref:Amine oxidase n=1 Tax=Littorina saxatilis TaxID=31220 RepID=A0AAN9C3G7_9CAEN